MKLNSRTLLTMSTFAFLCGTYEAYALFVSPWFSPPVDIATGTIEPPSEPSPAKPAENRRQAETYLSDRAWAAPDGQPGDSKYQFRSDTGFFYFNEWETVEPNGQVRFTPFAMIWRPKGHPPDKAPYTIVSDSALVEFVSKFDPKTNPNPGRVIGGALEGKVRIRGPDNLAIDGKHFNFAERALRIWSEHVVHFQQGPHKGNGHGLDLDLIPAPESKDLDKPAVSGIKTVRLRKDVEMRLVSEPKAPEKLNGAKPDTAKPAEDGVVFVNSEGSFNFDVEAHLATFEKNVRVKRPTGKDQSDRLNCDLLTLFFEPRASAPPATPPAPPATAETGSNFGSLDFRRLRAEGQVVTVASQRSDMQGRMNELTYDAKDRVIVLRDAKQVALLQKNNELLCPEITAGLDDKSQIERATCRGAGQLFQYALDDAPQRTRGTRPVELSAKWQKKLNKSFDAATGLDLIEFEGRAELSQVGKSSLTAETIRIWVTPSDQKFDKPGSEGGAQVQNPRDKGQARIQPKKLWAIDDVEFASPQIRGQTQTLQIWFDEGLLPSPPLAQATRQVPPTVQFPPPAQRTKQVAVTGATAPGARASGSLVSSPNSGRLRSATQVPGFAAVGDGPPARPSVNARAATIPAAATRQAAKPTNFRGKSAEKAASKPGPQPGPQPAPRPGKKEPENPLVVKADLIRVHVMRDGEESKISEVDTEGHVHVTQEHESGELPLDLTGDRLELKNYAGSNDNQIVDIRGRPARVQDRKMQLEGPDIHFDRITNNANVKKAGVLRVPVPNGMDGKPLAVPQMLDVFWNEKMDFDGEVARFYGGVRSKLEDSEMRCEEMRVTFSRRISFAADASGIDSNARANAPGQPAEIHSVVCRDNVDIKSCEYENNRLIGVRTARAVEFALDHTSGRITSQGPGTLVLWRRGHGNAAGMKPAASMRANKPQIAEPVDWEYTRIDFKGQMEGNTNARTTTFRDRVHVVYGPVSTSTDVIDEEKMPKDGGWMNCEELTLTQQPATKTALAYVTMRAIGNAELDGRSFHALAHMATYDESKGLYVLTGDGKRNATIWRETITGAEPSPVSAQGMEFIPATKEFKITHAAYGQGSR